MRTRSNYGVTGVAVTLSASSTGGYFGSEDLRLAKINGVWPVGAVVVVGTQKAIFGYGYTNTNVSMTNLVSNTGVVSNDTTGVGTARVAPAAATYGTDKAIFGFGITSVNVSITNLVSNTGVVATDTAGVGTARRYLAAAGYGTDKVSSDTTGVGTGRNGLAAAGYGIDKAIFGYGNAGAPLYSLTNKVSNTGVVASDTTGVGTARYALAAAGYSLT